MDVLEDSLEALEMSPPTAKQHMLSAARELNLPAIGEKILEELKSAGETATLISLQLKAQGKVQAALSERANKSDQHDYEQDGRIARNSEDIIRMNSVEDAKAAKSQTILYSLLSLVSGGILTVSISIIKKNINHNRRPLGGKLKQEQEG